MRKKHQNEEYQATKIRAYIQLAVHMAKDNPHLQENADLLWATMKYNFPELKDPAQCGGCGRSMKISIYEADLHDALLILAMARVVRENLRKGIPFTDANKVHIPTLKATQATLKRQTKCDYLGLVKQPDNWKGTGFWLLTGWAWKALRGEPISRAVKYWEGNLLVRSERTTTLSEMFENHRSLVQLAIAKRKAVRADYRAHFEDYHPSDWVDLEKLPWQKTLI